MPKNEWEVDRPAMRADTGGLTYGFQLAMDVADRSKGHPDASKKSKGAEDDSGTLKSSLENDLLCIKAQVRSVPRAPSLLPPPLVLLEVRCLTLNIPFLDRQISHSLDERRMLCELLSHRTDHLGTFGLGHARLAEEYSPAGGMQSTNESLSHTYRKPS